MSSKASRLSKDLEKHLRFEASMYSNVYGSLVICNYILNHSEDKKLIKSINKQWRWVERNVEEFAKIFENENWYEKLCEMFGLGEPDLSGHIALCVGKYNAVYLICDDSGTLHAIREDGRLPFKTVGDAIQNETVYRLVAADEQEKVENPNAEISEVTE